MKNDQTGKPPPTTPSRAAARHSTFSIIHSSLGGEAAAAAPATWRAQINQNLPTPRTTAISRKRHIYAMLKIISSILVVCLCVVGVYFLYMTLHDDPSDIKAPAKNQPLKNITLENPNGVLDHAWVVRALALPKNADMMQLNLAALRDRLLANPQIRAAVLARRFPDTLVIKLEERAPVARLLVQRAPAAAPDELLAAIDGTVYAGANYKPAALATLPYLADVPLRLAAPIPAPAAPATPAAPNALATSAASTAPAPAVTYAPIDGMGYIADLIATAQANIPDLYANWRSISLKRYADDRVLIVNNADASQVIFGAPARDDLRAPLTRRNDFRTQVARLDYIMDTLASSFPGHAPVRAIDLSVGDTPGGVQVPVTFYSTSGNNANSTTTATSTTITIRQR